VSRLNLPNVMVGNEFIVARPKLQVATPVVAAPVVVAPIVQQAPLQPVLGDVEFEFEKVPHKSVFGKILEFVHHYSLGVFALLFLVVSGSAIVVGSSYWSAHQFTAAITTVKHELVQPIQGPNTTVKTSDLDVTTQTISSQSLSLSIDGKTIPVSADTIRSWLKVVSNKSGISYIHVDQPAITKSLNEAVKPYIKAPVNQVSSTAADGSQQTIAVGKNGTKVGDIAPLVQQIGNGLISAKGMQLTVPTETQAFAVVSPASFDKLIEVNVVTKQMWLYDKGVLYQQFPISAGAPETPTPIGQYQIFSKLAVQDMRGYNANGTKYFQPHVHWINYFLPGGYAVHGNYWRSQSWFGAINSSHGCVSLPDDQAKIVYDWAPLGTTVITHT
jgi:lipoprotein-anchoring transpeptidase ErfK/SrfK